MSINSLYAELELRSQIWSQNGDWRIHQSKKEIEAMEMIECLWPLSSPLKYQTVLSWDCKRIGLHLKRMNMSPASKTELSQYCIYYERWRYGQFFFFKEISNQSSVIDCCPLKLKSKVSQEKVKFSCILKLLFLAVFRSHIPDSLKSPFILENKLSKCLCIYVLSALDGGQALCWLGPAWVQDLKQ